MTFPTPDHIRWAQTSAFEAFLNTDFYRWPSVALGQAILESAGWTRLSGRNNGLGIKDFRPGHGTTRTTHETINGVDRTVSQPFADFDTAYDCYLSHAYLFTRVGVYKDSLSAPDAESFIRRMGKHYATAPHYDDILINICRMKKLYQYDQPHGIPPVAAPSQSQVSPPPATLWSRFLHWLGFHL